MALATIIAVIITTYLQSTPQTQAGTYTLFQTDWSGGVSATETHSGASQTEIDTYSAKDANTAVNGSVTLSPAAGTPITQTLDAHFNLGTTSQTTVASDAVSLSQTSTAGTQTHTSDGDFSGGNFGSPAYTQVDTGQGRVRLTADRDLDIPNNGCYNGNKLKSFLFK